MKFLAAQKDAQEKLAANPQMQVSDLPEMPPVPLEYQLYVWRKKMHVSYNDMLATPFEAIMHDLEMMGMEGNFRAQAQQPAAAQQNYQPGRLGQ